LQKRGEDGQLGGVSIGESYVIGSHQIPILKTISIVIFLLTLSGIMIHGIFRINKKK